MSAVKKIRESAVSRTPISDEGRQTALDRAVAEVMAEGWSLETKPDVERVLVGRNQFRRALVKSQWGIRKRRELVDVDKYGKVSIRPV